MGIRKVAGAVRSFAGKHKRALGLAVGAVALGAGAYGASKLLRGRKRRSQRSNASLSRQVQRLNLKIKKKQLQRKLFKEEIRGY